VIALGVLWAPALVSVPAVVVVFVAIQIELRGVSSLLNFDPLQIIAGPASLVLWAIPIMFLGVLAGFIPGSICACLLIIAGGLRPLTFLHSVGFCTLVSSGFGLLISAAVPDRPVGPVLLFGFAGATGALLAGFIARNQGIVVPIEIASATPD
jgi:hypothetical protein